MGRFSRMLRLLVNHYAKEISMRNKSKEMTSATGTFPLKYAN